MIYDKHQAAQRLGISVEALSRRARRHGIGQPLNPTIHSSPRVFSERDLARLANLGRRGRPAQ